MNLSDIESRALAVIARAGSTTCANLGAILWKDKPHRSNCSCPFARPAGVVIKRLRARGLVERDHDGGVLTLYRLTRAGKEIVAA